MIVNIEHEVSFMRRNASRLLPFTAARVSSASIVGDMAVKNYDYLHIQKGLFE